jgi:FkbM family methyltransferase
MKNIRTTASCQDRNARDASDNCDIQRMTSKNVLPHRAWHWSAILRLRRAAVQAVLPLVPDKITLPIISGPARGMRWKRDNCNSCFWLGTYERPKCEALVRELKSTDVFYDIGANSGYYSLVAATRCKQVIAFEPFPRNIARFRVNIAQNKLRNVTLIERALSDREGMMRFVEGPNTESGFLSASGTTEVSVMTLDAVSLEAAPPNIIKMDIEGGELSALAGGMATLQRFRPVLFLATHSESVHLGCLQMLKNLNYEVELLQDDEIVARPGARV